MQWNEGYVADIDYPSGFFEEQSPAYLNFACVLNGYEPVALDAPFSYCELGSGRGLTANLLAASNPQGDFYAADFLPSHVAGARQLARSAQLDNLTLLEDSFADLAEGRVAGLPQFDFITLHGVYTWVTADNRGHIVNFIKRYLKPGGIVYVSYNALPGWNATLPLQRLMLEHADRHPGRSGAQLEGARRFIDTLRATKAGYFGAQQPRLQHRLDSLKNDNANYLAHEYMNRGWQPLYHADVARDLAAAKLDYVGSTELPMAFPHLYLSAEQQTLLDGMPDEIMRQTVQDYLLNTPFRNDVYVRGARRLTPARRLDCLRRMGLALIVPEVRAEAELDWVLGKVQLPPELLTPVLAALRAGPASFAQLAALPALAAAPQPALYPLAEMAALLVAAGQAAVYCVDAAPACAQAARRMNLAVARQSRFDDHYQALASPLLGNGVVAGLVQRLVYLALAEREGAMEQADVDPAAVAATVGAQMALQGLRLGAADAPAAAELADLEQTVRAILQHRLPLWRQLKML